MNGITCGKCSDWREIIQILGSLRVSRILTILSPSGGVVHGHLPLRDVTDAPRQGLDPPRGMGWHLLLYLPGL